MTPITTEHLQTLGSDLKETILREIRSVHHRIGEVKEDMGELRREIKMLNGRVRRTEIAVAVLKWAVGGAGVLSLALLVEFLRRVWP